jgi:MFS family permease
MSEAAVPMSEPGRAKVVLLSLILVAAVANLNLSVANVALPEIGESFDSSQTTLNLIAVGYSLGLAASVLWFGALGDRYGRKLMIVLGMVLSIPASIVAGFAPTDTVLFVARVVGGLSAGLAFPTTLALITALWVAGPGRTKAIALWSALGGGFAMLGPLISGILLEYFDWGSVFLVTLPLALLALFMAIRLVPAHVNESTEPVDNIGGILSAVLVGSLIISINFLPVPNATTIALVLLGVAIVAGIVFFLRERRAPNPLYDLKVAARPTFWVAACAGIIVFGSLMGAAFINQQYFQNVLGYSTVEAGAAILPAVLAMVLVAPRSAKLVQANGSRRTLLSGQLAIFLAFGGMLLLWDEGASYWIVMIPLLLLGVGVGLAGTPSSNSLTGSVPVTRVGMASGTADLQRDLGGALMTSIFGALLAAGYASEMGKLIDESGANVTEQTQRSSSSRSRAPTTSLRAICSTRARSRLRPSSPSSTATAGPMSPRWSPC